MQEHKKHIKTPWFTFIGPILIIVFYIGYIGYEKYDNYTTYQNDILWIKQKAEKINCPKINDLYTLLSDDGKFIMKVNKIKNDSILFYIPEVGNVLGHYKSNSAHSFRDSSRTIFLVWLTKNLLLECCSKKPEDFYSFKGQKIEKLKFLSTKELYLDRVDRE